MEFCLRLLAYLLISHSFLIHTLMHHARFTKHKQHCTTLHCFFHTKYKVKVKVKIGVEVLSCSIYFAKIFEHILNFIYKSPSALASADKYFGLTITQTQMLDYNHLIASKDCHQYFTDRCMSLNETDIGRTLARTKGIILLTRVNNVCTIIQDKIMQKCHETFFVTLRYSIIVLMISHTLHSRP